METKEAKRTHVRYEILAMIFIMTVVNYADRATMSITGTTITHTFGLSPVSLGFIFSGFAWSYAIGQIPGGWLLDRFGSKKVYAASIFLWSCFGLLEGSVGLIPLGSVVILFFALRFMLGLVESPAFPANGRVVATWFPTTERGLASSIFNSAQYLAAALFTPIMGWITVSFGWRPVFYFMGSLGIILGFVWVFRMCAPRGHPRINAAELEYLAQGGALVNIDAPARKDAPPLAPGVLKLLLTNRMLLGIYLGQYCITALTYFFITWFPIYLIRGRGMSIMHAGFVAALPAICGFSGGLLGGALSDLLLRRGYSVTLARKTPFVIGMLCACLLVVCNFLDAQWAVVAVMALAFFGKGMAAIGWAVISDVSPRQIVGLTGGVFNAFGNVAGIVTPIVIGAILQATGSFSGALWFVAAHAVLAMVGYLVVVGRIHRIELEAPAV